MTELKVGLESDSVNFFFDGFHLYTELSTKIRVQPRLRVTMIGL